MREVNFCTDANFAIVLVVVGDQNREAYPITGLTNGNERFAQQC